MLTAFMLTLALSAAPTNVESEFGNAKLTFAVPAGWIKSPTLSGAPRYELPIYKDGSFIPKALEGCVAVHRDPENAERTRVRELWGARDFQIYMVREVRSTTRDVGETEVKWELNVGHDTQFQMTKVLYSGTTPRYWWRGARKITVNGERYVIVVWKELDAEVTATEAEKSDVLKPLYAIVRDFSGKKK